MAYDPDALLTKLSQDYEFDTKTAFALGWCNVVQAQSRNMGHPVWIYYPLKEVWEDSNARKKLTAQFRGYDDLGMHECLPKANEVLSGKEAAGAIALITSRFPEENLMSEEREGRGTSWTDNDNFGVPLKIGGLRGFIEAGSILHGFGIVHASIGHETVSVSRVGNRPLVRFDLLSFGDPSAETPKSVPWFHAAFNAPETIGGGNPSKAGDVYSLAKFLIYFLVGPKKFMQLFSALPEEVVWDDESAQRMFDHTLWGNLAHDSQDPTAEDIKSASGNELSLEIAELLRRAVTQDQSTRLKDAQVLYQGFESSMGQVSPIIPGPIPGPTPGPTPASNSKTLRLVGVAALIVALLGGAWFFLQQQAKKRLIADMNTTCSGFVGDYDKLERSRIQDLPDWSRVEEIRSAIMRQKGDKALFEETLQLCAKGRFGIKELKSQLVLVLKDELARDIDFAREGGTDMKPLNLSKREETIRELEDERDFKGLEAELRVQSEDVRKAHDSVLQANLTLALQDLTKARGILGLSQPGEIEAQLVSGIEEALPMAPLASALVSKNTLVKEARDFVQSSLFDAARSRVGSLGATTDKLQDDGASKVGKGFKAIQTRQQNFAVAALPETTEAAAPYFQELGEIETGLAGLRAHMDGLADEADGYADQIRAHVKYARKQGWLEQGDLPDLMEQFKDHTPENIHSNWVAMKSMDLKFGAEMTRLKTLWASGIAVCEEMRSQLSATTELPETRAWRKLQKIVVTLTSSEQDGLGQEDFDLCKEGLFLIGQGKIELRAGDLLSEVAKTQSALESRGLGDFLSEYARAVEKAELLEGAPVPLSEPEYALFADRAKAVFELFDTAELAYEQLRNRNQTLTAEAAKLSKKISGLGLTSYTAYKEMQAALQPTDKGNLLDRTEATSGNVALQRELIRQFEAGELLNCSFAGMVLTPYHFSEDEVAAASALMPAGQNAANAPSRGCLSDTAVSMEALQTYRDGLAAREQSLKSEIDAASASDTGAATNVSYWLAARYADHVSERTGETFCVAPALATVLSASVKDSTLQTEPGELFDDKCGEGSPTGSKLVLYGIGAGKFGVGCVSVNRRQSDLSFRLAAGEICGQ